MTPFKLLVVDDDKNFRRLMRDFLGKKYTVHEAGSGAEALDKCAASFYDMVISDIRMPGMNGPALLMQIRELSPKTKTVLVTSYDIDAYVALAKKYSISSIMPKTVPFNYCELDLMVDGLLTGNIFGLKRYLRQNGEIAANYCIRSSLEGRDVREQISALFVAMFGTAGDMKLLLDEAITNAIYHAPRLDDGSQKYQEFEPVELEPGEYVYVECGHDSEKYGAAVSDNQGKLTKEVVLDRLDRHVYGKGIMDDSGRGIHMSRLFADRMIINIHPNVKTEVILINYFNQNYAGSKPIYINEL